MNNNLHHFQPPQETSPAEPIGAGGKAYSHAGSIAAYLLFTAYFIIGVFGRFPWKADEPYSFGIVWNMLQGGQWLVPYVGGDPFLEKPPLMFWLGALFARAAPSLAPHESSRLAVVACLALTVGALLWACALLRRETVHRQRRAGRETPPLPVWRISALALLVGMPGLAEHAHKFTADLGQLAGATLALAALMGGVSRRGPSMAVRQRVSHHPLFTGALFGTGVGMAFLSKGLLIVGIAGLALLGCLLALSRFRRVAGRFIPAAGLAAFPFLAPWPLLLYRESPCLFEEWFWVNNIGRFIGFTELGGHDNPFANRVLSLMLCGGPVSFLLLAGLLRAKPISGRGGGRPLLWGAFRQSPAYGTVLLYLIISLAVILSSASMRSLYLLSVLPAMVLAALPAVTRERRYGVRAGWLINLLTGSLLALIIATWLSLELHGEPGLLHRLWPGLDKVLPSSFSMRTGFYTMALTSTVIVLWWMVIRDRWGGGLLMCWSAGLAVLWCTALLLLMPWLDEARSYRTPFRPLSSLLGDCHCLATDGLGESELGMLHYVTGRSGVRIYAGWSGEGDGVTINPAAMACDLLLVQDQRADPQKQAAPGWHEIWRGHRPADSNGFVLYRREPVISAGG